MAGFHAERLLDAVHGFVRAELPAEMLAVWAMHDALDDAAERARVPFRAVLSWEWGDDPVLIERDQTEFPVVAVTGGSRESGARTDPVGGQASALTYRLAVEAWCVGDTPERARRYALRVSEALERVLQRHRAVELAPGEFAALATQERFSPEVDVGAVTAVRDEPAASGLTGVSESYYLVGTRLPLAYEA